MANKFLLISPVFYPDEVSTAGLFTDLCSVLVTKGYEVEVWCGQPSYTTLKRQPRRTSYKGIDIRYLPSTNFSKSNLPGRFANIVTLMISLVFRILLSGDKTTVFTHTTPPFTGILASMLCRLKKRKFIYILLDIYPEGLVRVGKVSGKNIFIRLWQRMFLSALKRSSRIIVIGRDMGKWIGEVCKQCIDKTEYMPHWQDNDKISPQKFEDNPLIRQLNIEDKFVIQYSGNMGLWHDMEALGKVVNLSLKSVFFIFVGGGIRKRELMDSISTEENSNVIFLPFQLSENLRNTLTACHAAIVSLKEGLEGMAVPSKIYGILAAGIPVIAMVPDSSEIALIVEEEECGIVVNPNDIDGLVKAIELLKENREMRVKMSINSRKAFEKKYTTRIAAESYARLIDAFSTL